MKKKVIFLNSHFQYSDGTVTALISLCNNLDTEKYDITIKPLFRCDRRLIAELHPEIKLEKAFGFYFKGFAKIVSLLPLKWLYIIFIGGKYDIEIGFQAGLPTLLVGNSQKKNAVHALWMHGYELWPSCYEKADKVICVSKFNEEKTRYEMGGKVNVTHCYNLVDDTEIIRTSLETVNEFPVLHPVFVSVGRHSPEKGYIRLVKILKELSDEGFSFSLVLVGNGPQHEEIKRTIEELNMEDIVFLTDEQTNPHKYTAKADVFICSSYSEGYSTACTEAAILNIPIITTCVAGGEEIINECNCGILTGMSDESLKVGIKEILLQPQLILKWKEILKYTKERFFLSTRKNATNDLFDEFYALSEKKHRSTLIKK